MEHPLVLLSCEEATAGADSQVLNVEADQPLTSGFLSAKSSRMICQLTEEAGGREPTLAFRDVSSFLWFLQDKGGFKITL